MNREKEDQLPLMQVGFIDSICLPIYEVSLKIICNQVGYPILYYVLLWFIVHSISSYVIHGYFIIVTY